MIIRGHNANSLCQLVLFTNYQRLYPKIGTIKTDGALRLSDPLLSVEAEIWRNAC